MNDFIKILLNVRSLRAALRELPFEQLVEIKSKFDEVFTEREAAELRYQEENGERLRKLAEWKSPSERRAPKSTSITKMARKNLDWSGPYAKSHR